MSDEIINELKQIYKTYLFTDEGKRHIQKAVEIKRQWREQCGMTDIQTKTSTVKPTIVPKFLRDRMTHIEITPIGLNNMCHITSELFAEKCDKVKKVMGYNITACPCSRRMSLEIHSVNKIGDKLYDFTKDFNEEKAKYFIEMDSTLTATQHNKVFGNDPIIINKKCKCPINWVNAKQYEMTESEIEKHIEEIESTVVKDLGFGYSIGRRVK